MKNTPEIHARVRTLTAEGLATTNRAHKTLDLIKEAEKEDASISAAFFPLAAKVIETYADVIMGTSDMIATYKHWEDYQSDELVIEQLTQATDQFHTGLMALNTALDEIDALLDEVTK